MREPYAQARMIGAALCLARTYAGDAKSADNRVSANEAARAAITHINRAVRLSDELAEWLQTHCPPQSPPSPSQEKSDDAP